MYLCVCRSSGAGCSHLSLLALLLLVSALLEFSLPTSLPRHPGPEVVNLRIASTVSTPNFDINHISLEASKIGEGDAT